MPQEQEPLGRRQFLALTGAGLAAPLLPQDLLAATLPQAAAATGEAPAESLPDPSPFGEVAHLGWVVRDLQRTVEYWRQLGLGSIYTEEAHRSPGVWYRGRQVDLVTRWGWTTLGGVGLELFEPAEGYSVYDEFLEKHREGIQHVAFRQESPEALERRVELLERQGVGVVQRGHFTNAGGQGTFAYLDTEPVGGVCFELVFDPNHRPGAPAREDHQYPFGPIVQYATVVPDVDRVMDYYRGLGFPMQRVDRDNQGLLRRYRGEAEDLRMHMGWGQFGRTSLEVIQPTWGRSIYKEFLEKHGEGFHHIAFEVEDMDEATALFDKCGAPVSQDGAWGRESIEGRFAYIDTEPVGGLTIELLWSAGS